MKLKRLICVFVALILSLAAMACQEPDNEEETSEFRASVDMLVEYMDLDEASAIDVLEILTSLGLDEQIEQIYVSEDDDGKTFYKVWFGLNLLNVYLDGGKVSEVYKYGDMIYPKAPDNETNENDNNTGSNNNDKNDSNNDDSNHENTPEPPKELNVTLVSLTSPIKAGKTATIEIISDPGVEYEIIVKYSSGASSAKGLEPKFSDNEGRVSWTWKVSANVKPGEYSITITSGNASYKTTFVVE